MNDAPFSDILSLLESQARRRGPAIALESGIDGSSLSYEMLYRRVSTMAGELARRGLVPGSARSRVAIVMPNGPEMSLALLAAACAGVAVPFNPAFRESEFHAYFTETGVSYLWVRQDDAGPARKVAAELGLELLEWMPDGGLAGSGPDGFPARAPDPGDVALILLTSGSTGRAKKVPLSHRNLCTSARDVCRSMALGPDDRCLCMWEQFHIGGLVDLLIAPLASGGRVISAGSFDAARLFSCLDRFRPTWFQGVPTTLREACLHAKAHGIDAAGSSLRLIRSVAAALPADWMSEIESRFGVPVIQTFGMTEASPLITSTGLLPDQRKPGSTGKPCGPELAIMDEQGKSLAPLVHGPIAVRGPNIFDGYEGDDEANAASFRGGWFLTGDTGYLDEEGFLYLTGRTKELINRGGEKIPPHEIDEVLLTHPAIAQAAAFGFPHPTLGEEVGAAVVLHAGESLAESAIRDHVSGRIAAFKIPRKILFLADLPRTPIGKVRREEVVRIALKHCASAPYQPPRNALETCLAGLWAAELDVPQVGIDDDFSQLGGDSLAAVRLVVATQNLLQLTLPDAVAGHLGSVREMARFLVRSGCSADLPDTASGNGERAGFTVREIQSALAGVGCGNAAVDFDPVAARLEMKNCQSSNEFRLFRQNHLTWITPRELLELLDPRAPRSRPWTIQETINPFRTVRWALNRKLWSRRIRSELAGFRDSLRWKRSVIGEHTWWFSADPLAASPGKKLIVGFGGFGNRLFMPAYRFLKHLDPDTYDVLLLSDPHRAHYEQGVPGLVSDIHALPDALEQFRRRKGYQEVIALGTSSGGLPAIVTALHNRWGKVIAIGADRLSDHPFLSAILDRLSSLHSGSQPTEVILVYAGMNARDVAGAEEISRKIPTARKLPDPRFSTHNLLDELHERSELQSFFANVLGQAAAEVGDIRSGDLTVASSSSRPIGMKRRQ